MVLSMKHEHKHKYEQEQEQEQDYKNVNKDEKALEKLYGNRRRKI